MFCLCLFTVTLTLLSSAQWACCDELPLMIINEIRAHYDELMLIIKRPFFLLVMIKVGSNVSPWEVPALAVCQCLVSSGRAAARGLDPIWKTCSQLFARAQTDCHSACTL